MGTFLQQTLSGMSIFHGFFDGDAKTSTSSAARRDKQPP